MVMLDVQRGTEAAISDRIAKSVLSGFGQVFLFVVVGPPIGFLAVAFLQAGKSGNGFDSPLVLVLIFFSYVIGFVPAVLAGCVFVPLQWIRDRLFGDRIIRLLLALPLGAIAGWISGSTHPLLWNSGSFAPAILQGSVVASAVCAVLVTLWMTRE